MNSTFMIIPCADSLFCGTAYAAKSVSYDFENAPLYEKVPRAVRIGPNSGHPCLGKPQPQLTDMASCAISSP